MESVDVILSSLFQSPAFHIILFHWSMLFKLLAPRTHEAFKEICQQVLFLWLFSTSFQIFNFHAYSLLNLICLRTYLMLLFSHLLFSHFTTKGMSLAHLKANFGAWPPGIKQRDHWNSDADIAKVHYFTDNKFFCKWK